MGTLAALGWGLAAGAAAAGGQLLAPALAARAGVAGCLLVACAWLVAGRRAHPGRRAYGLWCLLWGGFAGLALAGWTTARREASLEALALPRLAWVEGVAQREWERRWDTAWVRLGSVRLLGERCPGPDEGRPLVGGLQLEAAWELARAVPVEAGQRVCVRVVVRRPPRTSSTGTFPMRDYLQARGIVAVARVRSPERIQLVGADGRGVPRRLRLWARFQHRLVLQVAAPLGRRAGPRAERWFRAVALGQDQFLTTAERVELRGSGLAHLTSVSGMHVGLVAGPVALAARYLRRPAWQGLARAAAVAFGWLYAGATGMESPAVRALLMQAAALVVGLGRWRAHPLALVGWACGLQLLHNPWLARDVGFQLSYAATAGIAVASRWQAVLAPAGALRPAGAQRAGPAVRVVRGAAGALLVSLGAWSASAPVVARHFGGVSPWGIGASVLSAPVALGLVWGG
ncbi:MAG TPA: ComEC/Rec2 family competence protein, partial [Limnochordales bacterium]